MNSTDDLWQSLLAEACAAWQALPTGELKALPQFALHKARGNTDEIEYALWHENPQRLPAPQLHSFVLQATRKLGVMFSRNYLAGFAIDENGAIIPITDDVLAHYD